MDTKKEKVTYAWLLAQAQAKGFESVGDAIDAAVPADTIIAQPVERRQDWSGLPRYTYAHLENEQIGQFRAQNTEYVKLSDVQELLAAPAALPTEPLQWGDAPAQSSDSLGVKLHGTMDAKIWADEFVALNSASDHATMLGWFANAIMVGFDHASRRHEARIVELESGGATKAWSGELPPLPPRAGLTLTGPDRNRVRECLWDLPEFLSGKKEELFTATQVEAWGRSSVGAALEAAAQACEARIDPSTKAQLFQTMDVEAKQCAAAIRALNKLAPAGADEAPRLYQDNPVDDIAHLLAQELDSACLNQNDLVTVNREKLEGVARRVIEHAKNAITPAGAAQVGARGFESLTQYTGSAIAKIYTFEDELFVLADEAQKLFSAPGMPPQSAPTEPNSAPQSAVAVPQYMVTSLDALRHGLCKVNRTLDVSHLLHQVAAIKYDLENQGVLEAAAPTDAKRKPLTDDEITALLMQPGMTFECTGLVRAVERHHGIGTEGPSDA